MSTDAFIFGPLDVAEFVFYLFTLFFIGLVFYLRREDRREGYPLEEDTTGKLEPVDFPWMADPKTFALPHGHGVARTPNTTQDTRPLAMTRTAIWPGSPYEPTGDALADGIGPAAWAERADIVELTSHGDAKIVPMRADATFNIAKGDTDPRGLPVIGCDNVQAGVVADVWVDRAEQHIRYLEVELTAGRRVLMPMNMAVIGRGGGRLRVRAQSIRADQFAGVPSPARPDQITLLEEEKVVAYFGGGYLYAKPARKEPLL